jgi:hypothetical protein
LFAVKQRLAVSAMLVALFVLWIGCHRDPKPRTDVTSEKQTANVAPEKHLAPDGILFLTERVSITTNAGVTGIAPGSKVKLIARDGDKVRVSDGTTEIVVHPSQLTNDLDVARSLAAAERETQVQVTNAIAQQQREYQRTRTEQFEELAREQQSRTRQPAPPRWNNPLDRPVYNRTQDKKYLDSNGKTYWIDVQGRRHYDN